MAWLSLKTFSGQLRLICLTAVLCTGACAAAPAPRTTAERVADDMITTHVRAALVGNRYLYAKHIDVEVDRGVVHLDGMVFANDDYQHIRRIVRSVPGVVNIAMDLDLVRGGRR